MMQVERIDHIVLTVENIERSCTFYAAVLGMEIIEFAGQRKALKFGRQKINLHQKGNEFEPKATHPLPGAIDLCLLTLETMDEITSHLKRHEIKIVEGPVQRTGATGAIQSVYFRDPDGNLLELSTPC